MNNEMQALLTSIGVVAEMQSIHFKNLVAQGFSRAEALELTKNWLTSQLMITEQSRQFDKKMEADIL